jgi:hypothetical protein
VGAIDGVGHETRRAAEAEPGRGVGHQPGTNAPTTQVIADPMVAFVRPAREGQVRSSPGQVVVHLIGTDDLTVEYVNDSSCRVVAESSVSAARSG